MPPHNPHFTGRGSELADLARGLTGGSAVTVHSVHGLGGVGKTHTARPGRDSTRQPGHHRRPSHPGRHRLATDSGRTYLRVHARLAEARLLQERALAITEAAYGPGHPAVALRLNHLATTLQGLGEPEQVQLLLERAATISTVARRGVPHQT